MSEGPPSKLPARKEWDCVRGERGNTSETEDCPSSDYVDGWNDALDAVEQGTSVKPLSSSVFDDMMTLLASHPLTASTRVKIPQALIDALASDEDGVIPPKIVKIIDEGGGSVQGQCMDVSECPQVEE
jgi:hypothetical protein